MNDDVDKSEEPPHDAPQLKEYFISHPCSLKKFVDLGLVNEDGEVTCSGVRFNRYRSYLDKIKECQHEHESTKLKEMDDHDIEHDKRLKLWLTGQKNEYKEEANECGQNAENKLKELSQLQKRIQDKDAKLRIDKTNEKLLLSLDEYKKTARLIEAELQLEQMHEKHKKDMQDALLHMICGLEGDCQSSTKLTEEEKKNIKKAEDEDALNKAKKILQEKQVAGPTSAKEDVSRPDKPIDTAPPAQQTAVAENIAQPPSIPTPISDKIITPATKPVRDDLPQTPKTPEPPTAPSQKTPESEKPIPQSQQPIPDAQEIKPVTTANVPLSELSPRPESSSPTEIKKPYWLLEDDESSSPTQNDQPPILSPAPQAAEPSPTQNEQKPTLSPTPQVQPSLKESEHPTKLLSPPSQVEESSSPTQNDQPPILSPQTAEHPFKENDRPSMLPPPNAAQPSPMESEHPTKMLPPPPQTAEPTPKENDRPSMLSPGEPSPTQNDQKPILSPTPQTAEPTPMENDRPLMISPGSQAVQPSPTQNDRQPMLSLTPQVAEPSPKENDRPSMLSPGEPSPTQNDQKPIPQATEPTPMENDRPSMISSGPQEAAQPSPMETERPPMLSSDLQPVKSSIHEVDRSSLLPPGPADVKSSIREIDRSSLLPPGPAGVQSTIHEIDRSSMLPPNPRAVESIFIKESDRSSMLSPTPQAAELSFKENDHPSMSNPRPQAVESSPPPKDNERPLMMSPGPQTVQPSPRENDRPSMMDSGPQATQPPQRENDGTPYSPGQADQNEQPSLLSSSPQPAAEPSPTESGRSSLLPPGPQVAQPSSPTENYPSSISPGPKVPESTPKEYDDRPSLLSSSDPQADDESLSNERPSQGIVPESYPKLNDTSPSLPYSEYEPSETGKVPLTNQKPMENRYDDKPNLTNEMPPPENDNDYEIIDITVDELVDQIIEEQRRKVQDELNRLATGDVDGITMQSEDSMERVARTIAKLAVCREAHNKQLWAGHDEELIIKSSSSMSRVASSLVHKSLSKEVHYLEGAKKVLCAEERARNRQQISALVPPQNRQTFQEIQVHRVEIDKLSNAAQVEFNKLLLNRTSLLIGLRDFDAMPPKQEPPPPPKPIVPIPGGAGSPKKPSIPTPTSTTAPTTTPPTDGTRKSMEPHPSPSEAIDILPQRDVSDSVMDVRVDQAQFVKEHARPVASDMSTTAGLHVHKEGGESHIHVLGEGGGSVGGPVKPSLAVFDKNLLDTAKKDDCEAGPSSKKKITIEIKHGGASQPPHVSSVPCNPMAAPIPMEALARNPPHQSQSPRSSKGESAMKNIDEEDLCTDSDQADSSHPPAAAHNIQQNSTPQQHPPSTNPTSGGIEQRCLTPDDVRNSVLHQLSVIRDEVDSLRREIFESDRLAANPGEKFGPRPPQQPPPGPR